MRHRKRKEVLWRINIHVRSQSYSSVDGTINKSIKESNRTASIFVGVNFENNLHDKNN